jgi:HSP20 family protein
MALIKIEDELAEFDPPNAQLCAAEEDNSFRNVFAHFFSSRKPLFSMSHKIWNPPADVRETEEAYVVKIEVAGVKEENLRILMEDSILTVQGVRGEDEDADQKSIHLLEIHYGQFERKFILAPGLDVDGIKADYADGFLRIKIPKSTQQTEPIAVNIKTDNQ